MKKIFILVFMLFSILSSFSLDVINFNMELEFGIIPGGTFKTYDFTRKVHNNLPLFGDFRFRVNMFDNHLYFGVGSKVIIWKVMNSRTFKPDSVNFLFFAGIVINDNIEINIKHFCDHPVISWADGKRINTNLERWYEEISIKFSFDLFNED